MGMRGRVLDRNLGMNDETQETLNDYVQERMKTLYAVIEQSECLRYME